LHTSRPPEKCSLKRYFWPPGVFKNVFRCIFAYFQTTRTKSLKKIFITVWSGQRLVLIHLPILPDHQKLFFKKDIFERLEWLKTCFDAFAHRYFQTTKNFFSYKIFLNVWSGQKRVLMHLRILSDHQKLFFKKYIFERLEWLNTCFDAFRHTSRPPKTFFQIR
jgi:hypothetical protein